MLSEDHLEPNHVVGLHPIFDNRLLIRVEEASDPAGGAEPAGQVKRNR